MRQSSAVQRLSAARDPAEISKDVKESALWSYVRQPPPPPATTAAGQSNGHHQQPPQHRPVHRMLSTSQENLIDESTRDVAAEAQQQFHRSASARLPRLAKSKPPQSPSPGLLNTSLADQSGDMDNRRFEQVTTQFRWMFPLS